MKKLKLNSPLYVTKRANLSKRNSWLIRVGGMIVAFLIAGIITTILCPGKFGEFFASIFIGNFSTSSYFFNLLCSISIYILLSLAVTPAFKMKFWNIGVEGQALIGCILSAVILLLMPRSIPGPIVIIFALIFAVLGGALWAIIPTFFKVKFNTNETLFTLMMNYIATALAAFTIAMCAKGGSQKFPMITDTSRLIISIGSVKYVPIIVLAFVITVVMVFYMKKTKNGFELSVLGDSVNTARYVGINIKFVTYRTMLISGGIAGLVGFLLVCGQHASLTTTLVAGRGFTSVLIAWLGHFNPAEIAVFSSLIGFIDCGTSFAASRIGITSEAYYSGMIIGFFIIILVVTEFFINYKIKIHKKEETNKVDSNKTRKTLINKSKDKNNKLKIFKKGAK